MSIRIAVASSGLGHVRRGIESWALATAQGLAEEDEDVTLFGNWDPLKVQCRSKPFNAVPVGGLRRSSVVATSLARVMPGFTWRWGMKSAYGWEQLFFWRGIKRHVCKGNFDVLHLQDPMVALCAQSYCRRRCGTKVILAHGTEEEMAFLERIDHVQELSPHYHERHSATAAPRTRHCIPNFVDVDAFRPGDKTGCRRAFGLPEDRLMVLSVGAINRHRKRMDHLFSEFARARLADAVLVVAGACDEEGRDLVRDGKALLGDRLHVLENLPYGEMPRLYGSADVFVLCAHEEIFGIAFLEAMATGVPCIGHTFPVTEWILGDGGTCVDMLEPGALAAELGRYAQDSFRAERGAEARRRAENMFSWEAVYPRMIEMYREVVQSR